jgi:thiamine-monophosphate kinase
MKEPESSGEFERIARLKRRFHRVVPEVEIGAGDDCAVLRPNDAAIAISVDAQVEGVHFRRSWASLAVLGRRAVMAAASDLAAMGSRPIAIFSALILPKTFDDASLESLAEGFERAGDELGAPIAGGNLASGSELSITTTVIGGVGRAIRRDGAKPGDSIWVTGTIGARGLGLEVLLRDAARDALSLPFVGAWLEPRARIDAGLAIAPFATSAIDVSDGLAQDVGHLAESSGVRAVIEIERIPLASGAGELGARLGVDARRVALSSGDDYEIVFTLAADQTPPIAATHIGRIEVGSGIGAIDAGGRAVESGGYRHFG